MSITGNDADCAVGDLDINDSLTINGAGAATTIIQGASAYNPGTGVYTNSIGDKVIGINQDGTHLGLVVNINNVTIRWGNNTVPFGDASFAYTGAGVDVFFTGTGNSATFTNCVFTENTNFNSYGGGVNVDSGASGLPGDTATNVFRGTATFTGCAFTNNRTALWGTGLNLFSDKHDVNITNCNFSGNIALATGGGGAQGAGINIRHTNGGTVTITGCTISGNTSRGSGGGIAANSGGDQIVNISNSAITGNTTLNNGVTAWRGGGMSNANPSTTTLTNVLIANNDVHGGTAGLPQGGGLANEGGTMIVKNCTITGNVSAGDGGGFYTLSTAVTTMTNVTISNNRADSDGNATGTGGGINRSAGTVTLQNTIVDGNFKGAGAVVDEVIGAVNADFSLIGNTTGATITGANNQLNVSARLAALANNGGQTVGPAGFTAVLQTHALLAGSPALDNGSNALATAASLTTDQRGTGFARVLDAADANTTATADIGAYEAHPSVQAPANQTINEDQSLGIPFNIGDATLGFDSITATSGNTALVPNNIANISLSGSGSSRSLAINPLANQFGSTTITLTANATVAGTPQTMSDTFVLTVNPVADTPSASPNPATTNEDTQTGALVLSRNAVDGAEVTHFKITAITNGALFQNNGTTPINNNDFITFAQGNAGLKFTPAANQFGASGSFGFTFQAAVDSIGTGISPAVVEGITVNPVADTPSVTNATTVVNTQTTSGLVISRNAVDGAEVTHFKITNIVNGALFQNNGTTPINAGDFITFVQGNAGLKFTPPSTGPASFDVQASVSNANAGLGGSVVTANITVNAPPAFTNGPPPSPGVVGTAYNFSYTASGFPAPTFTVTAGALPTNLNLSAAGAITGSPTVAGTFTGTVTASNGVAPVATQNFSITINQAPAFTNAPPPSPGILNAPYNFTYTATGTPAPTFSVTAGGLPTGLTLSSGGVISGAPTATGTFAGTVTASNGVLPNATQNFSIIISQPPAITNGPPPSTGTVGTAYNFTYTATGSPTPTFSVTSGVLPTGLTLSNAGVISGTPTVGGVFSGVVTASNIGGSVTQNFGITITAPPAFTNGPPPSSAAKGAAYSFNYTASGFPAPTFSVTSGALPTGLTLSSAGAITGTPTATGPFTGVVTASNSTGNVTQNFSITVNQPPAFTNGPPPSPTTVSTAYNFTYTANGFPAPTFSVTTGALPTGLALSGAGAITGTPTTAGTFSGVVTASNSEGTATQSFTIVVNAAGSFFYIVNSNVSGGPFLDSTDSATHGGTGTQADPFQMSSLRGAVIAANSHAGATITLIAGTYVLTIPGDVPDRTFTGAGNFNSLIGDLNVNVSGIIIQGAGPASTTIKQTTADRVLVANPTTAPNFKFTLIGVTMTGGRETETGLNLGGAGMFTGGITNTTTISNCVFLNNKISGVGSLGGGAIVNTGGDLIITGCTFGGLNATDPNVSISSGGAISYDSSDFINNSLVGTMTIINSTFINNSASNGSGGGAITISNSNLSTATAIVTGCTFTGNQTTGSGGAIIVQSGTLNVTKSTFVNNSAQVGAGAIYGAGTANSVHFSRFIGNTSAIPANGKALNAQAAVFNADDNWWGQNTGPAANDVTANVTHATWLQLRNIANPTTILINNTSTLTADFTKNSASATIAASNLAALVGLPITFGNAQKGSLSGAQTAIQPSGGATAIFTGTSGGVGGADATVDSATVTAAITVNAPPAFTNGPPPSPGLVGTAYNFTCTASGFPVPTFSLASGSLPPGLTLSNGGAITGIPTTPGTFTGAITASNSTGSDTQNFSITVNQSPAFTNGPPPAAGSVGTAYNFTYTFTGTPAPTFTVTSGALPGGLSLSTAGVISGNPTASGVFSGVVTATNSVGTATQAFSITISAPPAFTNGPPPSPATLNAAYNFTYAASGFPVPTFSVTSGALPTGLTLSSAGAITGVPTATGTFTGVITASNAGGTVTQNFSITVIAKPTLTSPATFDALTASSAGLHSNVTSDGGSVITVRGFVISKTTDNNNPQLLGALVTDIPVAGTTGALDGNATGLSISTPYSFVAYATNAAGTTYTTPVSTFTTLNVTYTLGTNALTEAPAAGTDTVLLSVAPSGNSWTATTGDAWLHLSAPNQGGTDSALITFTFDANAGATRTGSINVSGQILTVTQAGVNYVAANPLTTLIGSGLGAPSHTAVDAAGNVFVVDRTSKTIKKWTAGTNAVSTVVASGLTDPIGVALDSAGNIYIADFGGNAVRKFTVGTSTLSTLVATGLTGPFGVAVDRAGNVFIANRGGNTINKWTAAAPTDPAPVLVSGLTTPDAVAVDVIGDLYIGQEGSNLVRKWTAATSTLSTLVGSGLNEPDGVAVDGSGNVYIGDRNNNAIKKWTAATGAVTTLVGSGLLGPQGVAVDTLGNVYLSDTDHNLVAESPRAFVAQAPKNEPATAGTDALSAVLPTGENLLPPFVPSSDQAWLTIGTITGGVVNFNFALNANASSRVGHITVLGVQTTVTQAADTAASIAVSSGSPQSTTVNTAFPAPLKAIVKDAASNPISGVTVTFTAPGGGASGTFAGGANTAVTDAAGIATSATFTANANAGGFNVSAAAPGAGSVNFVLTTNAAVTVAPASLPDWTVNKAGYTQTITNTGGTGASTFAVTVGAVPIGMTLTAGGVLNGTPTVANTFNFTVTATDTVGATGAQAYTVVINAAVVITTASLPNWTVNKTGYTQTITNTGGTGASTFAVTVGAVPTGMTLSAGGVLSGTPTVANTFNFTVTATDTVGATGAQAYTVVINPAVVITTASLPNWTVNKTGYTQTITNTGGTGASTFAVTVGAVPTGMTLTAGGVLSGTPTVANTFNFTITATDTVGATGAQAYTVVINPAVVITTASFPNWTVNKTGYTQTITNTGGTGASTFAVTVGAIPTGMTLSAGGALSGTPTVANTFNFTVTATDTVGATGAQAYTVVINAAVVVSPPALPNWTVNKSGYTQTVSASNGTGAKTLALTAGAVPTGLTFTAGTGVLSGTPTATGTFNFTVTATDTVGATGAQAYTVIINPAVVITTASLTNWTVNKAGYTQTITNTGGTGASTFAVTVGAVPTGLTLTAGGVLSGTPTVANTFNFTITATDTVGATGTQAYAVIINPAVTVSPATLPNWAANKTGYSQTVTSANGTGARTLSISAGAIPTGMTFTAATGVLDGTPTTPGTFNFTVTATDTVGATGAQAYTVIIHPPVTYTVTTTVNSIVVTDIGDNTDTLAVSELGAGNIQFDVAGRTFSINNGAPILGSSGVIPLTGVTAITINAAGGDDTINVGAFTVLMPSLTINGGTGNDTVNLNGDITFAANANLDLDLQNDTATPGTDSVNVAAGTNILTSGTGTITVKVSRNIALAAGSSFETVNGGITLEANQQAVTTAGSFIGVDINGAIVRSTGTGLVSVIGKGGNSGTDQAGVYVHAAGLISGGTTGTTIVTGFGGLASSGGVAQDAGVIVNGANTTITSAGSAVSVTGTGGGAGGATDNYGVSVDSGAQITAGGSGTVTVLGNGGNLTGTGGNNVGVAVYTSGAKITSGGGNVSVTGTGGGAGAATINIGVFLATTGQIAAGGTGTVTVIGNGGNANGAGGSNSGVQVISAGSAITSNGGDVSVTGTGGCLNGTGTANSGVFLNFSAAVTANGGNISLTGTGGGGAGSDTNHGLQLQSSSTVAATGNGSVTFTGTGGGGTGSSHGIRIVQTASVTAVNGNIAMTGSITDGTTASQGFSLSNAVAVGAKVQTTGSGTITVAADSMAISTSGVTMDAGTHSVTLRQKTFGQLINVGSTVDTTPNTLELSDGELDVITASTLKIGDAQSGPITVSAVISPANYKTLALARDTTFLGTGGFASDIGPLATDIENITVTGTLTINSGATLAMTPKGGFVPVNVQSFQIITNDGTDAVTGNFNGLPEQQAIPGFLGSGVNALITYVGGTGNDVVILTNRPPVAGVVSVERYPTQSVKIPVATILAQTSDPDPGDIVSFVSVGTPTAPAHGTLLVSGGFVFYTPLKPGGVVDQNADTFSYKVTDNHGAQSTGSVVVGIKVDNAPSLNITGLTLQPGGGVAVDFSGIPNRTYGLQFKVALADPAWTNIGPVTADQYGVGHYVDGPPPHASSSGFYRLVYPAP